MKLMPLPKPGMDIVPQGWWRSIVFPWTQLQDDVGEIRIADAKVSAMAEAYRQLGLDTSELQKALRVIEIRWGELLPKEKGGRGKLLSANNSLDDASLRHRFRTMAAHKGELLEYLESIETGDSESKLTRAALFRIISPKSEANLRTRRLAQAAKIDERIIVGDFREKGGVIADGSISLIFTDPPYDREAEELFDGLAQFAERVLCDGGSIVFYCGHLQLPAAFRAFANLRHWWTCANVYEGGGAKAMMREYGIRVCWKPLIWFVKTTRENKQDFLTDAHITPAKEKGWHVWQQTVIDARHWISAICPEGGVVCDTFLGGGTTALACEQLGLEWIGFEIDEQTAASTTERLDGKETLDTL